MFLRLFAMFFTILLTVGSAMQQAKYNEENLTKKATHQTSLEK
jgi:hypothetical protein